MKYSLVHIVFLFIVTSCLVKKSNSVEMSEIRPIAMIEEFNDTSFVQGSKKIYISNEPYYLESIDDFVPNLVEVVEDTFLKTKRERVFDKNRILSEQTIDRSNYDAEYIDLYYKVDTNGEYKYLVDCNKKEILQFSNNEDLSQYRKGLVMAVNYLKEECGKLDKKKVRMNFNDVVYEVKRDQLISEDSLIRFSYNLILADGKEVEYFVINCNPFNENIDIVYGTIVKNLKPINLKYSEIESLLNQVDSVESIEDYMEIALDSANNDLLLKVIAKKDYERIEKRKSKHTQVVFHVNVHSKEVVKISERRYTSFIAQ